MKIIQFIAPLLLIGCSTAGVVTDVWTSSEQIHPGQTQADVLNIMGKAPGHRAFNGTREAWQFCSTNFTTDYYTAVFFQNGKVYAMSPYSHDDSTGTCAIAYREIDWSKVPLL